MQIRSLVKNKHQNKQQKRRRKKKKTEEEDRRHLRCRRFDPKTINTSKSSNLYYILSFSPPNIFESKPLTLKSAALTLNPLSSHRLISRFSSSSSSSFVAYAQAEEDNYDDEDGEGEYEEEEEEQGDEGFELGKWRLAAAASSPPGEEAGRLYVGNLPYSVTSSQLAEIFGQAGTVGAAEEVKILNY